MSQSDLSESNRSYSGHRPSYLHNEVQINRNMSDFDEHMVKDLEMELQSEDYKDEEVVIEEPVDDTDKIRTYLRIRPSKHSGLYIKRDENTLAVKTLCLANIKRGLTENSETLFKFTKVLGPETAQIQVFDECVSSILERLFNGENCLIFGYGTTNSGKTHTMQGYGNDFGIVPRTLEFLFNHLEDKLYLRGDVKPHMFNQCANLDEKEILLLQEVKNKILRDSKGKLSQIDLDSFTSSLRPSLNGSSSSFGSNLEAQRMHGSIINSMPIVSAEDHVIPEGATLHCIWVSFAELYNEKIYDLFGYESLKKRKELKLMADKKGQVYIKDLTEVCVTSAEEAYKLFLAGKVNLKIAATDMNATSSRSHCFFSIRLVTVATKEGKVYPKQVHRLSFCDLAGVERAVQTGNVGNRLKESGNINQSLLVLLRCIRAMRDQQSKGKASAVPDFIPFRASKLTRLFQAFLTSASRVAMIVNINPDPKNFESTIQVLHNSAVASQVITVRKIEPPVNDTKFYRKVRESISLTQSLRQTHSDTTMNQMSQADAESYSCQTVVVSSKNVEQGRELRDCEARNRQLTLENQRLNQDLEDKDDEVVRLRTLLDVIKTQDEEAAVQSSKYQKAIDVYHEKRLSLQAKVIKTDHDTEIAILKEKLKANNIQADECESLSSEDDDKENYSNASFRTPKPLPFSKIILKQNKRIEQLVEVNNDLNQVVSALRFSLDDVNQEKKVIKADMKDKELLLQEIIENQKATINRFEDELSSLTNKDPIAREEEIKLQLIQFNKENERLNVENAQLKAELQDGQSTCVEYHTKLVEANQNIEKLTDAVNAETMEVTKLKFDLNIMHDSYEILSQKVKQKKNQSERSEKASVGTVTTPTLQFGPSMVRGTSKLKSRAATGRKKVGAKLYSDLSLLDGDETP